MKSPDIRQLLIAVRSGGWKLGNGTAEDELAERVEAVLKEIESLDAGAYETVALSRVLDLLNGGKP